MSPIAHLRRFRRLPHALLAVLLMAVAQTSLVPCAMAYGAAQAETAPPAQAMPAMDDHCAYCPPDAPAPADASACAYPHAPTVDVFASSAHHVDVILSNPLLHQSAFDASSLRVARTFIDNAYSAPPHSRPLTLTHCVQLK